MYFVDALRNWAKTNLFLAWQQDKPCIQLVGKLARITLSLKESVSVSSRTRLYVTAAIVVVSPSKWSGLESVIIVLEKVNLENS